MLLTPSQIRSQKHLALSLMYFHGGQGSNVYTVASCMLSDSDKGVLYEPKNHRGHTPTEETAGAVRMARFELEGLRKNANYPEAVRPADEKKANRLADKLAAYQ